MVRRCFVGRAFGTESAEFVSVASESSSSEDRAAETPCPTVLRERLTYEDFAEMSEGICVCRYADDVSIVAPEEAFEVVEGPGLRPHEEAPSSSDQVIGERRVEYSDRFLFNNPRDGLYDPVLEAFPSRRAGLEEIRSSDSTVDELSVGTSLLSLRSAADDMSGRDQSILTSAASSSSAVQKPRAPVPKAPPRFDHSQWVAPNAIPKPKGGGYWTPHPKVVPDREGVIRRRSQSIPKKNPPPRASPKSGDHA